MGSFLSASRIAALAAVCLCLGACRQARSAETPSIVFTTVPEAAESGGEKVAVVAGRVTGARAGQRLVLFAKSAVWWVQPFIAEPFTEIKADSTWSSTIHLGMEYGALLVDSDYQPPATIEALPPPGGSVLAVQTVKGTGSYVRPGDRTLTFSGYEWEIRQVPSDRGGANDYDPRNAWVDDNGHLHLLLTKRDGRWTSGEVRLMRSLGYGTYVFTVRDTSQLDPAAALGLHTWDDLGADQNHRELDIELSRWGTTTEKDARYVVQPHYAPANVFRFSVPSSALTHSLRWEPGRAVFKTVQQASSRAEAIVAQREFTSGVPVSGTETIRMNLLYFRGSPAPPRGDVEAVIEKFEYLP